MADYRGYVKVIKAEPSPAARWHLKLECGHFFFCNTKCPPKKVRCRECIHNRAATKKEND